jgi:hypothetical protein
MVASKQMRAPRAASRRGASQTPFAGRSGFQKSARGLSELNIARSSHAGEAHAPREAGCICALVYGVQRTGRRGRPRREGAFRAKTGAKSHQRR